MHRTLVLAICLSLALLAAGYRVIDKIAIPGDGGWDYLTVDNDGRRLFVSHSTKVDVVDLNTKKVVATISNTNGVHGIVIAPEVGKGFTSNGRDNTVTMFRLQNLTVVGTAKTGENPDAMVYEPSTKRLFVFNGRSKDATVIDAEAGTVTGTIALGGKPEYPQTDGKGTVWVNIEDTSELVRLNAKSMKVEQRWKLAPCVEPTSLAYDAKNSRLFSVCSNKLMVVVNAASGKVVTSVPIGDGCDGVVFDDSTGTIFAANGEGTMTVVKQDSADKYHVAESVKTQSGARTVTLDPKTKLIYMPVADLGPPDPASKRPAAKPGTFHVLVIGQ